MISKRKKSNWGTIVNCEEVDVLDSPDIGSPLVCQLRAGKRIKIISKPNKNYYGVGITNSVVGFVEKDYVEAE